MKTLATEINELLAAYGAAEATMTHDGQVLFRDHDELDIYTADEALEVALDIAILHEDVVANPGEYHIDTLAYHGVTIPANHPQYGWTPCASGISSDCTGEGSAYAGRCLPCDLELAAREEWAAMEFEGRY